MPSNKLSGRRATAAAPHVCHPPPPIPPLIPPPWAWPTTMHYAAQAITPDFEGNAVDNWDYELTEDTPGWFTGGGYSDMGRWSTTNVEIYPNTPGYFWIEVQYDAGFFMGLYAHKANTTIQTPQPFTYIFPPWDSVPSEGTLDAFLNF